MHVLTIGLNHNTAPVEVRERLAFAAGALPEALRALRGLPGACEAAILSTCNRCEVYTVAADLNGLAGQVEDFLAQFHQLEPLDWRRCLYRHSDSAAVRHLFTVACGVDSMVVGESQILGQVRDAFQVARQSGVCDVLLDELFRRAIHIGKRARTETEIGRGAVSVGSAAVGLAASIFGDLSSRAALLIGAGEMGAITARHLLDAGVTRLLVVNRTAERAQELAPDLGGEAAPWDQLEQRMTEADIVISSTAATTAVLTAEQVAAALRRRRQRPLFLIDLAVPRDIDPNVHRLDQAFLYNIDDLQSVVDENRERREREVVKVKEMVDEEVESFMRWVAGLSAKPVLSALHRRMEATRRRKLESALNKLPNLSKREQKVVASHLKAYGSELMHEVLAFVHQAAESPQGYRDLEAVRRMFHLDADSDVEGDR